MNFEQQVYGVPDEADEVQHEGGTRARGDHLDHGVACTHVRVV